MLDLSSALVATTDQTNCAQNKCQASYTRTPSMCGNSNNHKLSAGDPVVTPRAAVSPPDGSTLSLPVRRLKAAIIERAPAANLRPLILARSGHGCDVTSPPAPPAQSSTSRPPSHSAVRHHTACCYKMSPTDGADTLHREMSPHTAPRPASQFDRSTLSASVQSRIERLFGPGVLCSGFRRVRSASSKSAQPAVTAGVNGGVTAPTQARVSQSLAESQAVSASPALCRRVTDSRAPPEAAGESISTVATSVPAAEATGETGRKYAACAVDMPGHRFIKIMEKESARLLALSTQVETDLSANTHLCSDVEGKLRAASGKARLLIEQKFRQFYGLCEKNINQECGEQFPTTEDDLLGFWEMMGQQVQHIDTLMAEIGALRDRNWQPLSPIENAVTAPSIGAEQSSSVCPRERAKQPSVVDTRKSTTTSTNTAAAPATSGGSNDKQRRRKLREMMRERRSQCSARVGGVSGECIDIYVSANHNT